MKFVRRLLFAVGKDSRQLPWLVAQMSAVALLELLTLGGIPPLVSLLTRPEEAVNSPGIRTLYGLTGVSSVGAFIWVFGFALLLLFVLKTILSAATSYRQFKFSYRVQMSLGKRMLQRLLAHDYSFFLQQNTAILLKNVTTEVLLFTGGVLIPSLQLVTQAMITVTIVGLLAWASPATAAITVVIIGGMIALLYMSLHRKLTAWGLVREVKLGQRTRHWPVSRRSRPQDRSACFSMSLSATVLLTRGRIRCTRPRRSPRHLSSSWCCSAEAFASCSTTQRVARTSGRSYPLSLSSASQRTGYFRPHARFSPTS